MITTNPKRNLSKKDIKGVTRLFQDAAHQADASLLSKEEAQKGREAHTQAACERFVKHHGLKLRPSQIKHRLNNIRKKNGGGR